MDLAEKVGRGRAHAELLHVDTFQAYSPNGYDTVNGLKVLRYAAEGLPQKGKTQGGSSSTADVATEFVLVGGVRRVLVRGGLHIAVSAPVPVAGDRGLGWEYQCVAVGKESDPSGLGRRYLVWNSPGKSLATARRLDVVEVPAP